MMNSKTWIRYVGWIFLTVAVGWLSGFLTKDGVELYNQTIQQPPLSPPSIVFPIVWGILYILMGISVARISMTQQSGLRTKAMVLYGIQLAMNFFWSLIFFNLQKFGIAFLWLIILWCLILAMILVFQKIDVIASRLQIPYLLWVTFAAYLNLGVWLLN